MTSPEREPPPSRTLALCQNGKDRLDLERKILAAAFKTSFECGDSSGAALAHKGLCSIIQQQLFSGDGSSGSVIPASIWNRAQESADSTTSATMSAVDLESTIPPGQQTPVENGNGLDKNGHAAEPMAEEQSQAEKPVTSDGQIAAEALAQISAAAAEEASASARELGLTPDSAVPSGGPATYLDFGGDDTPAQAAPEPALGTPGVFEDDEPSPEAVAEMLALAGQYDNRQQMAMTPSQLIKMQSFYQILGVNKLSSIEEIHTAFLRIIRKMLRSRYAPNSPIRDMREYREVLRAICVAHDVLKDPITRTDYDLRLLGMRNAGQIETPVDAKPSLVSRTRLMLGELLECANILEPAELQAALDMHKAEPGIQFGEFLVSTGFVSRDVLDSTLLAQKLINGGKISVAQFQTAMFRMRDIGTAFFDTLMVEGWILPRDIFDESSDLFTSSGSSEAERPSAAATTIGTLSKEELMAQEAALLNSLSEDDCEQSDADESISEPAPDSVPADSESRKKKVEFNEKWTEKDAMAETQAIDLSTIHAVIQARSEEKGD